MNFIEKFEFILTEYLEQILCTLCNSCSVNILYVSNKFCNTAEMIIVFKFMYKNVFINKIFELRCWDREITKITARNIHGRGCDM